MKIFSEVDDLLPRIETINSDNNVELWLNNNVSFFVGVEILNLDKPLEDTTVTLNLVIYVNDNKVCSLEFDDVLPISLVSQNIAVGIRSFLEEPGLLKDIIATSIARQAKLDLALTGELEREVVFVLNYKIFQTETRVSLAKFQKVVGSIDSINTDI